VGLDGVVGAGSQVTASGANGTIWQLLTAASNPFTFSAYVRRVTGTGTVNMTLDAGLTWTPIALTADYQRFSITQTILNPTAGFQLVTSGDQIVVDYTNVEQATNASSPIITTAAQASRAAETLTGSYSSFFSAAQGTALLTGVFPVPVALATTPVLFSIGTDANNRIAILYPQASNYFQMTATVGGVANVDSTTTQSTAPQVTGTAWRVAVSWGNGAAAFAVNNGTTRPGVFSGTGTLPTLSTLTLGLPGASIVGVQEIASLRVWPTPITGSALAALVA
jgi:hypothetical protein